MVTTRQDLPERERRSELYLRLLVALDASDHANRGLACAVQIAKLTEGARICGVHAYSASLHDQRFRQMEGGLPEIYRKEAELERQRDVHDELITRGLRIISDSYLDVGARACESAGVPFERRMPEGKNYREIAAEVASLDHDLLVLGAHGVGAVPGQQLGTVCERVVRRTSIDTLVIRDPAGRTFDGPIVVAIDGSERAYGGLLTALELGRRMARPVTAVAAFDPYYHYVVFDKIARCLSEEGAKVFRFEEQEALHEAIIDSGLGKIYQSHLDVAKTMAAELGAELDTVLLCGKPIAAISTFLEERGPTLLVLGKTGIHADDELDIGGTTERLLRAARCDLLISCRAIVPRVDIVARCTTSWTAEAEARLARAPSFVQSMARMAILRFARERGHTVITESIVEEATAALMPKGAASTMRWTPQASALCATIPDPPMVENVRLRAEKHARAEGRPEVQEDDVRPFLPTAKEPLAWHDDAIACLERVPGGFMRNAARKRIEQMAVEQGRPVVDLEICETWLALLRKRIDPAG